MSVYTTLQFKELQDFLTLYALGELISFKGISGGITNTNYFVDTTHGRYVLTIFEVLQAHELPFYLNLTLYLNRNKIACPAPVPQKNGELYSLLKNKPATLITCLNGAEVNEPNEKQCFNVGAMLAKMHLVSINFTETMENPRYQNWWNTAAVLLSPKLSAADQWLLNDEIVFLNTRLPNDMLPKGIIHADLFKDNILMYYNDVAGFIDFYYACNGNFIYDLAITTNDWVRNQKNQLNITLQNALLAGYESVRPLTKTEKGYFNIALRAAALRFWVSRLIDAHFPTAGEITFIKNPDDFRDLLLYHRKTSD